MEARYGSSMATMEIILMKIAPKPATAEWIEDVERSGRLVGITSVYQLGSNDIDITEALEANKGRLDCFDEGTQIHTLLRQHIYQQKRESTKLENCNRVSPWVFKDGELI